MKILSLSVKWLCDCRFHAVPYVNTYLMKSLCAYSALEYGDGANRKRNRTQFKIKEGSQMLAVWRSLLGFPKKISLLQHNKVKLSLNVSTYDSVINYNEI